MKFQVRSVQGKWSLLVLLLQAGNPQFFSELKVTLSFLTGFKLVGFRD